MTSEGREQLFSDWLAGAYGEDGSERYNAYLRADKRLDALMPRPPRHEDDAVGNPAEALEILIDFSARPMTGRQRALLAAGLMEDFLVRYGDTFIEQVEAEAKRNPPFNRLLGGVWQNAMSDALWQRVRAACTEEW